MLFVVPFGDVVDVTRTIDYAMWAFHVLVHPLYIACSIREKEFSAILFGEDEIWLAEGLAHIGIAHQEGAMQG